MGFKKCKKLSFLALFGPEIIRRGVARTISRSAGRDTGLAHIDRHCINTKSRLHKPVVFVLCKVGFPVAGARSIVHVIECGGSKTTHEQALLSISAQGAITETFRNAKYLELV